MLDIQRVRIARFPELPSEVSRIRKNWLKEICKGCLSTTEIMTCGIVGFTIGVLFWTQDIDTALITSLIGLCTLITLWFLDMLQNREILATKTFYTDFPVHGLACIQNDLVAVSGGGGGLSYGIPDQCAIMSLQTNAKESNILASHVINNSTADKQGTATLRRVELTVHQCLTPYSFWGVAGSEEYICGGVAGIFHMFRVLSKSEAYESSSHYILQKDPKGRSLLPIGSHKLVDQPFLAKKKLLIQTCCLFNNKAAVLTENNILAYYTVLNDSLCYVGQINLSERILDIHFNSDGSKLFALTSDRSIVIMNTPSFSLEGGLKIPWVEGLSNLDFHRENESTIILNKNPDSWKPMGRICLDKTAKVSPRFIRMLDGSDKHQKMVLLGPLLSDPRSDVFVIGQA